MYPPLWFELGGGKPPYCRCKPLRCIIGKREQQRDPHGRRRCRTCVHVSLTRPDVHVIQIRSACCEPAVVAQAQLTHTHTHSHSNTDTHTHTYSRTDTDTQQHTQGTGQKQVKAGAHFASHLNALLRLIRPLQKGSLNRAACRGRGRARITICSQRNC